MPLVDARRHRRGFDRRVPQIASGLRLVSVDVMFEWLNTHMTARAHERGVAGAVWSVSIGGRVAYGSAGWLDPVAQRPMPHDALFRIASMSKPIVAVAALQLVDAGAHGLDDAIDAMLPELADRRVLIDPHGAIDQPTAPADRALTLRDLLSFRCGLGMDFDFSHPQPVLDEMWRLGVGPGPTAPECSPDEYLARVASLPLADQPGTRWRYHTGSDLVSVLIERMRGESLDTVLARDVFAPIGMVDTGFWVRPASRNRLGVCRMAGDGGELEIWDTAAGRWSQPPQFRSGATGLVATAADLIAFGQMLLARGAAPGGRVLSSAMVGEMTTDQLTDDQRRRARIDDESSALGWGLGLAVRREPGPAWPSVGSYGWDGGLGCRWLVDPATDVCAVLLSTDAFTSARAPALMDDFVEAIGAIATASGA